MNSIISKSDPCSNCESTDYHKKYLGNFSPTNCHSYDNMPYHQHDAVNVILACDQCIDGLQSKSKFCYQCRHTIKTSNDDAGIYFEYPNSEIRWICDPCYLNNQWCDCIIFFPRRIHLKIANCRSNNTYRYQFDPKLDQHVKSITCLHCNSNDYTTGYFCASGINCTLLESTPIYIIRCDQCISKTAVNQCDHCKQRGLNSYICDICMTMATCKDCSTIACYPCSNMDYCMECGEHNDIYICYSCARSKHRGYFVCTNCYLQVVLNNCPRCFSDIFEDSFISCSQCNQICHLYCGKIYCEKCDDYTIKLTGNCPNCGIVKDNPAENCSKCQIKLNPLATCTKCKIILKDLENRLKNTGIAADPKHIEYYDWKCNECLIGQMKKKIKGKSIIFS